MSTVNVGILNLEYGAPVGIVLPSYTAANLPTGANASEGDIVLQTDDKVLLIYLSGVWTELSDIQ